MDKMIPIIVIRQVMDECLAWDVAGPLPFYGRMTDMGYPRQIEVFDGKKKVPFRANDITKEEWDKFNRDLPPSGNLYEITDSFLKKFEKGFPWLLNAYTPRYRYLSTHIDQRWGFSEMEYVLSQVALQWLLRILMDTQAEDRRLYPPLPVFVSKLVRAKMQQRETLLLWKETRFGFRFKRNTPEAIREYEIRKGEYHEKVVELAKDKLLPDIMDAYPDVHPSLPFIPNGNGLWLPNHKYLANLAGLPEEAIL